MVTLLDTKGVGVHYADAQQRAQALWRFKVYDATQHQGTERRPGSAAPGGGLQARPATGTDPFTQRGRKAVLFGARL